MGTKILNATLILLNLGGPNVFYFTVNENMFLYKNMVPMLYKYVSVCIKYLHYIYVI